MFSNLNLPFFHYNWNLKQQNWNQQIRSAPRAFHQDSVVDLKHLSFSDWLASVSGSSVDLQRYLPTIQESYDTVSQMLGSWWIWGHFEMNFIFFCGKKVGDQEDEEKVLV